MRTPEITKERILDYSGRLFNTQGYKATSISDITKATGLTKGAVYRHFKNKEVLEVETLKYLENVMMTGVRMRIKEKKTAPDKLKAVFRFFESYISHPPVTGGCPLLNVSIEADDTDPVLRKKAVGILDILRASVVTILSNGIKHHQIKKHIDKDFYATIIIASLEGAIMMSKLVGDDHDIRKVIRHLNKMVAEIEL